MIDAKERFSGIANTYDIYRPSYPDNLIKWILKTARVHQGDLVADIGCGTGIASRLIAKKGLQVTGIEPNREMLSIAIEKNGGLQYRQGSAERTGFSDHSIDVVISAEAFHWFDLGKTMPELQRILKPRGFCCAFWNVREKTPLLKEYDELLKSYSTEYPTMRRCKDTIADIKVFPSIKKLVEKQFTYSQTMTLDDLIGRAYTVSYIVYGVKDHDAFKRKLEMLFKKFSSNGKITFDYKTTAILWTFKKAYV